MEEMGIQDLGLEKGSIMIRNPGRFRVGEARLTRVEGMLFLTCILRYVIASRFTVVVDLSTTFYCFPV